MARYKVRANIPLNGRDQPWAVVDRKQPGFRGWQMCANKATAQAVCCALNNHNSLRARLGRLIAEVRQWWGA